MHFHLALLVLLQQHSVGATDDQDACDPQTGPSNGRRMAYQCTKTNDQYSGYQWSSCLPDRYVDNTSNGKRSCAAGDRYCWQNCMTEFYNLPKGLVHPDCTCSSFRRLTPSLPDYCYELNETRCDWFTECFYLKFPGEVLTSQILGCDMCWSKITALDTRKGRLHMRCSCNNITAYEME